MSTTCHPGFTPRNARNAAGWRVASWLRSSAGRSPLPIAAATGSAVDSPAASAAAPRNRQAVKMTRLRSGWPIIGIPFVHWLEHGSEPIFGQRLPATGREMLPQRALEPCRLGQQPLAKRHDGWLADAGIRHEQIVMQVEFDHLWKRCAQRPFGEVARRIGEAAERNALAGGGGLQRQVPIVETQAAHRIDAARSGRAEPFRPARRPSGATHRIVVYERHAGEIDRPPYRVRAKQGRARNGCHEFTEERVRRGAVEAPATESYGDVDLVLVEVERPGLRSQAQIDTRHAPREPR